ncbi:hypothetical protein [Streptomyces sp. NPDC020141]|uniref:hypothetical protein n=1 Tax=Streptomyces sp. NPDC020141 TaxID=3365065 RepID=UPI00378E58B9
MIFSSSYAKVMAAASAAHRSALFPQRSSRVFSAISGSLRERISSAGIWSRCSGVW